MEVVASSEELVLTAEVAAQHLTSVFVLHYSTLPTALQPGPLLLPCS